MCLLDRQRMENAVRVARLPQEAAMKASPGLMTVLQAVLALASAGPLLAQSSQTLSVSAHMDIWQSGGYSDGSGGVAPAAYTFPAAPGQTLTFSSVTGTWSCGNGATPYGPDGTNTGNCYFGAYTFNPTGPFSGLDTTDFVGPLVGMFLEDTLPTSAPPTLRFYWSDNSQGGIRINFTTLSPQIGQVFFIGDGNNGPARAPFRRLASHQQPRIFISAILTSATMRSPVVTVITLAR